MELTNEQRKYLGLEIIEPAWERVEIPSNCLKPELSTGKDILFFDGDILRKVIWLDDEGSFSGKFLLSQDAGRSYHDRSDYGQGQAQKAEWCKPSALYALRNVSSF